MRRRQMREPLFRRGGHRRQLRRARGADHGRQRLGQEAPALRIVGFRQELDRAGTERLKGRTHFGAIGPRGEQDRRHRTPAPEARENSEAVELRHHDVEQEDIGPQTLDEIDGGFAVGRFADDLDARRAGEETSQDGAHRRRVVDDDDRDLAWGGGRHSRFRPQLPVRRRTVSTRSVATRLCLVR